MRLPTERRKREQALLFHTHTRNGKPTKTRLHGRVSCCRTALQSVSRTSIAWTDDRCSSLAAAATPSTLTTHSLPLHHQARSSLVDATSTLSSSARPLLPNFGLSP